MIFLKQKNKFINQFEMQSFISTTGSETI
ncbi:hypothetical protein PT2222_140085 [Paraburkholderia tropica]